MTTGQSLAGRRSRFYRIGIAGCGAFLAFAGVAREIPENLCGLRPPVKASWQPGRTDGETVGVNAFTLTGRMGVSVASAFFPAYCVSGRARISFRYTSDIPARKVSFIAYHRMNEKPLPGTNVKGYFERGLPPTAEEKLFSYEFGVPVSDFWGNQLGVYSSGETGTLKARDVRIEELPPEKPLGKPFNVGARRVTEIAVLDSADAVRFTEEYRMARMVRFMLYANGYDYLRVRRVTELADIGPNAILIGRAAEEAGFFSSDDLKVTKGLTGAGVYRAKGTRLGITGALPTGIAYGAFACMRDLGIEYLGGTQWRKPAGEALDVPAGFGAVRVPSIPLRCAGNSYGSMVELRGRCSLNKIYGNPSFGKKKGHSGPDHSMPTCLITTDEFADSHPEFFALQKDGKRHGKGTRPCELQYCFSNPELQRIAADRFLEFMRADPGAVLYQMAPGDGGGADCKCENCRKMGTTSDVWVHFANAIASRTKREFPNKYIAIYSYVDTPYAPVTDVKMDPNVIVTYCVYPPETWPNCMRWNVPMNRHGFEALAGWRKLCPRLGMVLYPTQCGEQMSLWPGFDSDVEATRDFSRHKALMSRFFGLAPLHGTSISQSEAFVDLRINVLGHLEEDPSYDVRKGTLDFIRDFYGAAEKPMLEYFDTIRAEPARRDWVQNCEQHLKGFVTKEFAAKCLPLLDAAEAAAKDDPARLVAVQHEKILFLWTYLTDICRARANVSKAELPAWATRYGEFCRLCRDTRVSYMGGCVKTWFNDTAFLDLKFGVDDHWTEHPVIQRVIRDPVKELGQDYPNNQRETKDGIEIPARGMGGAIFYENNYWRRKDKSEVRCLRRMSSGYGLAFTRVTLAEAPKGDVTMLMRGIDNDKPSPAEMEVLVNDTRVFRGPVTWKKDSWTDMSLTVPAALLHAGDNDIVIKNVTEDTEKDGVCGDRFIATRNYFWGWFTVERLLFKLP